jgi:hypothetical protein
MSNQPTTLQREGELAKTFSNLTDEQQEVVKFESYDRALREFDALDALESANDDPENPFNWEDVRIEIDRDIDINQDCGFHLVTGVDERYGQVTHDIAFNFVATWLDELKDELLERPTDKGTLGGDL